jgi:fatty acid desaturase
MLITDWRSAWRYFSVWAAGATALLATAYEYLPDAREILPEGWVKWAALAIIAARVIRQSERGHDRADT